MTRALCLLLESSDSFTYLGIVFQYNDKLHLCMKTLNDEVQKRPC